MIVPQEAIDRFERRASEMRALLRRARAEGRDAPTEAYLDSFLARYRGERAKLVEAAITRMQGACDAAVGTQLPTV